MAEGGIYDQLGGGFALQRRWAVVDYTSKMLYDNGPLLRMRTCGVDRQPLCARRHDTAAWVMREMQSPDGGFSSLDADSNMKKASFTCGRGMRCRRR